MGTYPEWAALVGGVLEVAGWSGFLANLDEFYDAADVEVDEKKPFLAAWWIAFTTTPVEARTLFHRLVGRGALLGDESIMTLSLGGKDDGGSPKAMGRGCCATAIRRWSWGCCRASGRARRPGP